MTDVEQAFLSILRKVGTMTNSSGLIAPQPLKPEGYVGHGMPFDFLGLARAFWETLCRPMKSRPVEVDPSDLTGTRYSPVGGALVPGTFA